MKYEFKNIDGRTQSFRATSFLDVLDLVNQIQKSLSLNDKASVDTAMRKLQSLTRNNVQTNYGQRVKLAEELSKYGGQDISSSSVLASEMSVGVG